MRRDLKSGKQYAWAEEMHSNNSVQLRFNWGEPDSGNLQEVYVMDPVRFVAVQCGYSRRIMDEACHIDERRISINDR